MLYVVNSNEGLGGNWGSEIYVSNGGQRKKQLTNNTEYVTQKQPPWAQAPEVCVNIFHFFHSSASGKYNLDCAATRQHCLGVRDGEAFNVES